MKIKKVRWLVVLVVVAMMLAMVPAVGGANSYRTSQEYTLFAGQNTIVGKVTVRVSDENDVLVLNVKYEMAEGVTKHGSYNWLADVYFTEMHLAVAKSLDDFRANGWVNRPGNPIPGRFPYKAYFDPGVKDDIFSIPLAELGVEAGDELIVAAHAVVEGYVGCDFYEETAWAAECQSAGETRFISRGNWATYVKFAVPGGSNSSGDNTGNESSACEDNESSACEDNESSACEDNESSACEDNESSACEGNENGACESGAGEGFGPGGMPAAHGFDNMGECASELAQSSPGAVAEHMGAGSDEGFGPGGMPAAHGFDNMGECASTLARSEPGAVAAHMGRR